MSKRFFFWLLFSGILQLCVGQKHDFNMMFGYFNNATNPLLGGMNMDFNTSPPKIFPVKKKIDFSFYCGICSDSSGVLAFYTNGISIRDTTHYIMLNGDTINPGPLWVDWKNRSYPNGPFCFALPAPGKYKQYYLFHMATALFDGWLVTSPYYYTVIDMEGNNGLGQVTVKNQIILPPDKDYIDPVAVKHGNGRDWWIITGEVQKPLLYTFLLDPDGIHGPFTTVMPYQFPGNEYQSVNDISPDGNTYVRAAGRLGLYIYDFDRCSGTLHNFRAIPFANQNFLCFAAVFAADSRHLYLSSWQAAVTIDIKAPDIIASLDSLAYFDGYASPGQPFLTSFWNPNLAPDGKIYYATRNTTLSMHLVHNPNLPGQAADFEQHGVAFSKVNDGTMCLFPNYRLGEWENSPCDTLNAQQPGDSFEKTIWSQPVVRSEDEFYILPPLFKIEGSFDNGKVPIRDPNMAELAIQRMREKNEKAETKETKGKN